MKHPCYKIFWLLTGLLLGCHSQPIANHPSPFHPLNPSLKAMDLFTPAQGQRTFKVTEGPHQGTIWQAEDSAPQDHTWQLRMKGRFVVDYRFTPDGKVVIEREDDFDSSARVAYDPPLVMLPENLAQHVPQWTTVKMTVTTLDGKMIRDQGQCRYQVQILGRNDQGVAIRMIRELQLRFAQGRVILDYILKEGHGLVAQRTDKQLTILGILPRNTLEAFEVTQ